MSRFTSRRSARGTCRTHPSSSRPRATRRRPRRCGSSRWWRTRRTSRTRTSCPSSPAASTTTTRRLWRSRDGLKTRNFKLEWLSLSLSLSRRFSRSLEIASSRSWRQALRQCIAHPFLCKYKEEDCIFVKNVTKEAMLASLETLRDLVKKVNTLEKADQGEGRETTRAASHARERGETHSQHVPTWLLL